MKFKNNEMITGIIKLKKENEKGKLYLKYSYVRNTDKSIKKFMSFAKSKHNAEYVNFYERGRKFLYRKTI